MGDRYERWMTNSICRLYPERGWIPHAASIGKRLKQKLGSYRFDRRLLDAIRPNPIQLVRSSYAYARYESYHRLEAEAKALALSFFENCYFVHREDAEGYFYLTFFPRYFRYAIRVMARDCLRYLFNVVKRDKAPFLTLRLAIEVVYHDQIGEWQEWAG